MLSWQNTTLLAEQHPGAAALYHIQYLETIIWIPA
jgi:hypothetical protein